jgi:hypothetical protein
MVATVTASTTVSLVHELVAHGVVSPAEFNSQRVQFEEVSMSHAAFRVSVGGELRAFVKRADPVRSQGRDLRAEATLYRIAATERALAGIIPRCQLISNDDRLIVLDALPDASNNLRWKISGPVLNGSAGHPVLRAYGRAVARVHTVDPPPFGEAPWILLAFESDWGSNPDLPAPVRRLFGELSTQSTFRRGFRHAWSTWQPTGLMHGDLRWTNVLPSSDVRPHVWLVDWELSCLGDPAWDVGSALADIVSSASLASGNVATMEQFIDTAAPFLSAYREAARLPLPAWRRLLSRSALNAGVRLVQVVSEHGHISGPDMDVVKELILPWSAALLRDHRPIAAELDRVASS